MSLKFCPIASGSSGNCTYIGTKATNILVDAGISGKRITDGLDKLNVSGRNIDAILITHEHTDHTKGAGIISRRFNIPVYATVGTWNAMAKDIGHISSENIKYIYTDEKLTINDLFVMPFDIPHDAAEPVGFEFYSENTKAAIITDIGHVTERIKEAANNSNVVLLEANHDINMLKNGRYPLSLKKRIMGELGHLSNDTCASLITEIFSSDLKYLYLAHLSEENNMPHLAYETVEEILRKNKIVAGKDFFMDLAARYSVSKLVELGSEAV